MIISPDGLAQLKQFEGCRLKAYQDIVGIWTIGYGFTDGIHEGMIITQAQAENMLLDRLVPYEQAVQDACTVTPTQAQFDACVCLAWNIGISAFQKSSVLKFHNQGKFKEAANAFGLWNKAGGKVVAGLVRRRSAESALYLEDYGPASDMPQKVDVPVSMAKSGINLAQATAGITASLAAVQPIIDAINAFKSGVDGLGQWAVPAVLIGIVGLCGYTIWQRVQLRNRGQA
jgi:lysozyme